MLPSPLEGRTAGQWPYTYNPTKAKALLAEAGYPNGFKVELSYNSGNSEREQTSIAVQAQLRKIGVQAELKELPWGTMVTNFMEGKMPMFVLSDLRLPIVETYLTDIFHSKSAGPKGNYAFYANPEVDQLIGRLQSTNDPAQRKQIIVRTQELINVDVPSVPIYETMLMYAHRSWVKGWTLYPSGAWFFAPVEKRQ
jgi:ABC-type transport system substrate-binding protein